MSERGMAIDSSEQVPGQQTNESSDRNDIIENESSGEKGLGEGPHAGEGDPR